jgi:hypothetical protein
MKMGNFEVKIYEEIPWICYLIYGVVAFVFGMFTIGFLGFGFPTPAAITALPVVFCAWRIMQIARGKSWKPN